MSNEPPSTVHDPSSAEPQAAQLKCAQCGAPIVYAPGTHETLCEHCGHRNSIDTAGHVVQEQDFHRAMADLASASDTIERLNIECKSCGATTEFEPNVRSQECPFCGTPIVAHAVSQRVIKPRALLPFGLDRDKARACFGTWITKLWFAPSDLKKLAWIDGHMAGMYLPFWTFDAKSVTPYRGERGDDYWDTVRVPVTVNGRTTWQTRQVRKTRWRHASGTVQNRFDDVLVAASTSLPHDKLMRLGQWDLGRLVPYSEGYISGFRSESYTIDLEAGFTAARQRMEDAIRATIRQDIGGDHQRIHQMWPRYHDITFKHLLLPIWVAVYRYKGKPYRILVNARDGTVNGERPWSAWKIAFAVAGALAVIAFVLFIVLMAQNR
jgi:DNA-directed RNA polymerase subunit RPC12/RpoP